MCIHFLADPVYYWNAPLWTTYISLRHAATHTATQPIYFSIKVRGQQNASPDTKLNLVSSVWWVTPRPYGTHSYHWPTHPDTRHQPLHRSSPETSNTQHCASAATRFRSWKLRLSERVTEKLPSSGTWRRVVWYKSVEVGRGLWYPEDIDRKFAPKCR